MVQLSQAVCAGLTQLYSLGCRFRCFLCYAATVPHMDLCYAGYVESNFLYKFHSYSPQYYTKYKVVDFGPQSSDYPDKFLQCRLQRVFTAGESKMTNVTFSYSSTAYRGMTNTLSYVIKRVQQLYNLEIYSSEEPTETVRWQHVYMTSGVT